MAAMDTRSGFEIVGREDFSDAAYSLIITHPLMARVAKPGQFVTVMANEGSERIPLTIADFEGDRGTITLVVLAVGRTSKKMQQTCTVGSSLFAVDGPMGVPSPLDDSKKVICVGGGLGVAPIFPQARGFQANGAHVIGVLGFRTEGLVFWKEKFEAICDELILCTDDGSAGVKGIVSDGIKRAIEGHGNIDEVIAIGPPLMMKACAEVTRPHGIKTMVNLGPIMVDGAGKCAGCRIDLGGEMKFACVDGPYFDGHAVNFDDLVGRIRRFAEQRKVKARSWSEDCLMMCEVAPAAGQASATEGSSETLLKLLELPDPFDEVSGG
jgi:NAD(P)H-flavin reductase